MKIKGLGVDIVEIDRVMRAAQNPRFLKKIFSEREIEYFKGRNMNMATIAGSFAAKEACVKALGSGFVGLPPKNVEVLRDCHGKPYIVCGREDLNFLVSISHCRDYAVAEVIAFCED